MATLNFITRTHFDFGAVQQLGKELARLDAKRPLIITDPGVRAVGILDKVLEACALPDAVVFEETPPNPTEASVGAALEVYQANDCDGVICVGGGSPIDLGKAVSLLAGSDGDLKRYEPLQGGGRNIRDIAPLIAIPTTAGTGSEVSTGFVIIMDDGRKTTFVSPKLKPALAICDPELTLGLPPLLTAATGMDAIAHCIEAIFSPVVNPPADGIGLDGLWRAWPHIERAVSDGSDREARWNMMMASTEGSIAFSTKGLGAVHAMSHAAGRIPGLKLHHGTLNAVLLPPVIRVNREVAGEKMARITAAMGLPPGTDVAVEIERMNARLGLPANLSEMQVEHAMLDDLVHYACSDFASRTNPVQLDAEGYRKLFLEVMPA